MDGIRQWWQRLFPGRVRVTLDGHGYRVNGEWCASQVEVRSRLEQLGLPDREIAEILWHLNQEKYGNPQR